MTNSSRHPVFTQVILSACIWQSLTSSGGRGLLTKCVAQDNLLFCFRPAAAYNMREHTSTHSCHGQHILFHSTSCKDTGCEQAYQCPLWSCAFSPSPGTSHRCPGHEQAHWCLLWSCAFSLPPLGHLVDAQDRSEHVHAHSCPACLFSFPFNLMWMPRTQVSMLVLALVLHILSPSTWTSVRCPGQEQAHWCPLWSCVFSLPLLGHLADAQDRSEYAGACSGPACSLSLCLDISWMPRTGVSMYVPTPSCVFSCSFPFQCNMNAQDRSEHVHVYSCPVHLLSFPINLMWTPRTQVSTSVPTLILCICSPPHQHLADAPGHEQAHWCSLLSWASVFCHHFDIIQVPRT